MSRGVDLCVIHLLYFNQYVQGEAKKKKKVWWGKAIY